MKRRNTTSFIPNGGIERRSSVKPTVPLGNASEGQTDTFLATDRYEDDQVFEDNKRQSSILSNSTNQN